MIGYVETFWKLLGMIASFVFSWIKNWCARLRLSNKAIKGDDLAGQGSLENLVRVELTKLALHNNLPLELQSLDCRNWLRLGENNKLFVQALIGANGNGNELAKQAEVALAISYEQLTGETRHLAAGRVTLAVSHAYGQLTATPARRQELDTAILTWTAAQVGKQNNPELNNFPSVTDLARVRAMALSLLAAGKKSWKMPDFIAPLNLAVQEVKNNDKSHPTNVTALADVVEAGDSLILFGEGGIGKTTFLLDLCSICMNDAKHRIPLYIDAAAWARSSTKLLNYIASNPAAQINDVTAAELARLADAGCLTIMINGWNEISMSQKATCQDSLNELTGAAGAHSVIVASRTSNDAPGLPLAKRVKVQGLTWHGQSTVIRAELGEELSEQLLTLLTKDTRLLHAARSPLILRGLIANAKRGSIAASSVYDLLGAVVIDFEEDDQRRPILSDAPVNDFQRHYLEELACHLYSNQIVSASREDALPAIKRVSDRLNPASDPPAVLNILGSHHLLHVEDGVVRFAHQRFQEYFAATRLLCECIEGTDPSALLLDAINLPAWDDAVTLVAGKLRGDAHAAARVHLVKTVARLDLGYSCDLAGLCALREADDTDLYHDLVSRVNELIASPVEEIRDLGVAYQIASGFPAFAENLWRMLEEEDQQARLQTHRLNRSRISLIQLGLGADKRVAAWPSERRIEFLHEVAGNADNYDFLVRIANAEPDHAVRSAAISALFWHYPASKEPIKAWLAAPEAVQTEYNVLSCIEYALEEGDAEEDVRKHILALATNNASENVQLKLAIAFPVEIGPRVLDVIFAHLRKIVRQGRDTQLIAIANTNDPERLLSLATDLVVGARPVPDWAATFVLGLSTEARAEAFERAWAILQSAEFKSLDPSALGPLAALSQTRRSVDVWLQHCIDRRGKWNKVEHDRGQQLGSLLARAPGNDLLRAVMERGQAASYDEASELIDLVRIRINHDDGGATRVDPWLPTTDEVRQLISCFSEKSEAVTIRQDRVFVFLSCIASNVAPNEFSSLLLDTCHRHLDAWTTFRDAVDQWAKKPESQRPYNPSLGNYLIAALAKWGPDAIPGLLALMAHSSAMELVPEAIGRIVDLPWVNKRNGVFRSVGNDVSEGEQRRQAGHVLQQPADTYQAITDEAARTLGQKLNELIERLLQEKSTAGNWNSKQAAYGIQRLISIVAHIPSPEIELPVNGALASGLVDVYGFVGALRGLVKQGLLLSDKRVVDQLEALYEQEANITWRPDSEKYVMVQLSELMYCVEPPTLLSKPLSHYLAQWQRFTYTTEVIRHLGSLPAKTAWPSIVELGKELASKGQPPEELVSALASTLTVDQFTHFLELVTDGTLFSWCRSVWNLESIAPKVALVIGKDIARMEALQSACQQVGSSLADSFACAVLVQAKSSNATRLRLGFDAVDAGRAVDPHMPSYQMLLDMFKHHSPTSYEGQYEIHPNSCNELRAQLYLRAKGNGLIAIGCKRLLASLESQRRNDGRPLDETRHPDPSDGAAWTDTLTDS
jgi:hypothetical protein